MSTRHTYKTVILVIFMNMATIVFSESIKTPKEILNLMEASRARYVFWGAEIDYCGYKPSDKEESLPIQQAHKILSIKKTPTERLIDVDSTIMDSRAGKESSFQEKFYFSSVYDKWYHSGKNGEIIRSGEHRGRHFYTVEEALWGLCSYRWEVLVNQIDKGVLLFDTEKKLYVLEISIHNGANAPWLRLYIDPLKDYVPVQGEILFEDKTLFIREETSNWVQKSGLWVPLKYKTSMHLPDDKSWGEYTVKSIEINRPIADKLDFSFPLSTVVDDKIRGVKYVVKDVEATADVSVVDNPANLPPPAMDGVLADANLKAQELLAQQKQAASGGMQVVPIEIAPSYVWVLPGKNEYVLSISADGKKPSLVKHTFEPDGLVVQGLENKIASDGKIRVSLERPAEHKSFANGVLMLEFADQKATVHFVAAPLE